ncbi:AAA family ATPase [Starkeya sp. ORNL1]|uniref:AAA family ATPase n=1 Tax=Starkeya sp. ORNL1 TaxID=2709380 RepID=UPI0014649561|nr:AAA family ATPase [Starkeya sp. ORNL1]QJP14364.1 AAA family ATPase [Starkeya sp. ORNL1]
MNLRIGEVSASGYRSLRGIRFPVEDLTVFVGANGVGKTNLYRALQLIQSAASGTLSRELAAEGGMESALWAGRRQAREPVRIRFEVSLHHDAGDFGYSIEIGLPFKTAAAFAFEPQVKEETLTLATGRRPLVLMQRRGPSVTAMDDTGRRQEIGLSLMASETALGSLDDPGRFPDLHLVRRTLRDWRFYHELRTDLASALRQPCLAVTTPTLASDGSDLAAVFATLTHIRQDTVDLDRAVDDAFPGARLEVPAPGRTASFGMRFPDHPDRVFETSELSDGTLRYLALMGALLSYRLPALIALNEPETSLHPDLMEPLARLIAAASRRTQVWLVTHSQALANALAASGAVRPRTVLKRDGETWIDGLRRFGQFAEDEDDEEEEA